MPLRTRIPVGFQVHLVGKRTRRHNILPDPCLYMLVVLAIFTTLKILVPSLFFAQHFWKFNERTSTVRSGLSPILDAAMEQ